MVSDKVERTILCKIRYTLFLALQFLNKSIFEIEIERILCDFIILGLRQSPVDPGIMAGFMLGRIL